MSYPVLSTPQRPLPGTYTMTPAPERRQSTAPVAQPSIFRKPSSSQLVASLQKDQLPQGQQSTSVASTGSTQSLSPIERAARTINETLGQEARYPELDSCISREFA